jgi:Tol biopolymer transport system component
MQDLKSGETIALLPGSAYHDSVPRLSPDGSRFTAAIDFQIPPGSHSDLYEVDMQGQARRLTFIQGDFYDSGLLYYAWSPDGRYIAFWLIIYKDFEDKIITLAVVDVAAQVVTDYCIERFWVDGKLVWSPDSQNLLVETFSPSNPEQKLLALLDLAHNIAYVLDETLTPVGWIK